MRCKRCGAYLPDGVLRCNRCGEDVRIVPDYNPLDEVLAAQVRGSIDGSDAPLDRMDYTQVQRRQNVNSRQGRAAQTSASTRREGEHRGTKPQMTPEQRKRQAARKRAIKKKKRQRAILLLSFFAVLCLLVIFIFYQNSYKGQLKKGYKAMNQHEYAKAEEYFNKAIDKKPTRKDAYLGMIDLYLAQDEEEKAEDRLLEAIDKYPDSAEVYDATFQFYEKTKNAGEIPKLLNEADDKVMEALSAYKCSKPEFSLDAEKEYDDVQQLSLESSEKEIYYTTDGSDPFTSSSRIKYEEPIQISEGENTIKAVSVNQKKIPSLVVSKTYMVELPMEDAPAVSPSTGQYDEYTEIRITVPEGYTAYYTMDGTDPTEKSELYTDAIDMPSGSTIFKAVLVNAKGRLSSVTTRNYELIAE